MNVWTKRGYDIFDPVDAAGNPRKVINGEVQVWSTEVERAIYYAMVSGNLAYATKADLDADLAHDDGTVAWVVADTAALNGIYVKSGASGTGSWTKERNLPTGPQGDIGGVAYRFDAGTADADPGTGLIRANNADLSAATELYVSKSNRYGDDLSAFLATLAGSTSTHKGYLILTAPDSETQAAFSVSGVTDAAGYVKLSVSSQGGATAFSDAERLIFLFSRTGNAGDLNGVNPGVTGLELLESNSPSDGRSVLAVSAVVEDIISLKALDTAKDAVAYLKEAGRDGAFVWRSGDYSGEVAADPAEGVFAKADSVATTSGAWVRSGRIGLPVEWFGAKGDDTTDDTAAINAAFAFAGAMGGGDVLFKAKTYKITGPINVASSNVTWRGESRYGTLIKQYTLSEKIFNVTGAIGCGGQKFATIYAGTPVSGATALYVDSSYFGATEFMVRNGWKGIEVTNRSGPMFTNFEVFDYESVGLHAYSINDVYVNSFIMNAGNAARGVAGGVRLTDKVEAFICCNGDILLGQYSLTTDAASYTANNRPAYNNFSNVYFDSGARGCLVTKLVETEFVGCWFSGGRTNTTPGLTLSGQTDSLTFVSCRFFNNGSHGFYASNQAARVKLIGCKFQSNSMTAGSGASHGAYFDGTVGFVVTACSAGNSLYSGQQGYGIYIGAGCSGFSIRDGDMTGNVTGTISDNSGAVEKYISGVRGYKTQNKGTGSIAVGQTVAVVSHGLAVTPTAADISISFASSPPASGVSSIYINNITSTTFQVVSNAAVSSTPLTFSWQARVSGA